MQIDFMELAYDIIGGSVLGGIAGVVEYTIAGAVASLPAAFITAAVAAPLALVTGALVFAGALFGKVGSSMYKKANTAQ
jgi:hypothetical protein